MVRPGRRQDPSAVLSRCPRPALFPRCAIEAVCDNRSSWPYRRSRVVTFLFSDIEGSTRLFRELGDRYPEILDLHNQALRKVWEEHSGEWMSPGEVTPSWPRFPWATPITLEAWWTVMATYPSPRGAANPLWRPILTDLLSADRS